MATLLEAVGAALDVAPVQALLPGGVWDAEPEEDKTRPYLVFDWIDGQDPEFTTEEAYTETGRLRMRVFGEGQSATDAVAKQLFGYLDWADLTVDGLRIVGARRGRYRSPSEAQRTPAGQLCFAAEWSYEIEMNRSL